MEKVPPVGQEPHLMVPVVPSPVTTLGWRNSGVGTRARAEGWGRTEVPEEGLDELLQQHPEKEEPFFRLLQLQEPPTRGEVDVPEGPHTPREFPEEGSGGGEELPKHLKVFVRVEGQLFFPVGPVGVHLGLEVLHRHVPHHQPRPQVWTRLSVRSPVLLNRPGPFTRYRLRHTRLVPSPVSCPAPTSPYLSPDKIWDLIG